MGEIWTIIQLAGFIVGIVGVYWKLQLSVNQQIKDTEKMKNDIAKINSLEFEIEKMKNELTIKDEYQKEMIERILQPSLDKINEKMCEYVDVKTRIINKEIENIKSENLEFRSDIKEIFKEFKSDQKEHFDFLIKSLKNK